MVQEKAAAAAQDKGAEEPETKEVGWSSSLAWCDTGKQACLVKSAEHLAPVWPRLFGRAVSAEAIASAPCPSLWACT
jgi:hypothetical protein